MSILNRPSDGLLSVLLALRRALIACGPMPEAQLLALCAPSSVVPEGKPEMARRTIARWKQLGFFEEVDGRLTLRSDLAAMHADDLDGVRAAVLRLVFAPENNPTLTSSGGDDNEKTRSSDCTFASAWALMQDPYVFPARYRGGVENLQVTQDVNPRPFANDTRWAGFAEWSTFLGIAWTAPKVGLVPAPVFAVRMVLPDVFTTTSELPQQQFFTRIASALPVVDGGLYHRAVRRQVGNMWRPERDNQISPCLSAALLALEARGDLGFETRSDAPERVLLGRHGREIRRVTHVVRSGVL